MSRIKLSVRGLGHVVSFKNNKLLIGRKGNCSPRLITNPKLQKWMEKCTELFVAQLRSSFRTRGIEIPTEPQALSWIASWMPLDDSAAWIGELSVNWRSVKKGEEGCDVEISPIETL